jgi:hypothetical protein
MVAVLEDAIECFQKYLFASSAQQRRLFREATTWLWEGQPGQLFSFEDVCHGLDLNPDYIRRGLEQWRERQIDALRAGKAPPQDHCDRKSKC